MNNPRLSILFKRYVVNELSQVEEAEFYGLVGDPENREPLQGLLDAWIMGKVADASMPAESRDAMLEAIFRASPGNKARVRKLNWPRWSVAAAVIIVLGIAGLFIVISNKQQHQIVRTVREDFKNDVPPGTNRAILTLANNSQILLDSAKTGMLAMQGYMKVIKTDSGKLTYLPADSAQPPMAIQYNTLSTPRGGQYRLVLPDGSQVWLNAASSIRYPAVFTGKERMVEITGEVYFEVVHNPAQPFKVKAGEQLIEDIGTAFNVNAYPDEDGIRTTLIEGAVKVSVGGKASLLKPGDQAVFNIQHSTFSIQQNADLEEAVAWKNGYYKYNSSDIQTLMRQAARWYDVEVIYEGGVPKDRFTGKISRSVNLSEWLKVLQYSEVHFKIEGRKLTVIP